MAAKKDSSGYRIFSEGELGRAHVAAHRMLDLNRPEQGYRWLKRWLDGREGEGAEWLHLQWHMLVFELAVGEWHDAHRRWMRHLLPVAASTDLAATDAPAGLWRLALSAPGPVELRWDAVRDGAVSRLHRPRGHYVELHDLLALAGAGDVGSLERWLAWRESNGERDDILLELGRALCLYAGGAYQPAAMAFARGLPGLSSLGGSRAQNELFHQIHQTASMRSAA